MMPTFVHRTGLAPVAQLVVALAWLSPHVMAAGPQPEKQFSASELREDFTYLYRTLQETNYDLFRHTAKEVLDNEYSRVLESISRPMTPLEAHRSFQRFVTLANLSHCKFEFPLDEFKKWYGSGGLFFPFEITFDGERTFVAINYSNSSDISPGDELLAINDKLMGKILTELYAFISGENEYSKRAMIELSTTTYYYWYAFGDFREGRIRIRKPDGRILHSDVVGIDAQELVRKMETAGHMEFVKDGREFRFIDGVAYLRPGDFLNASSNDINSHESMRSEEFQEFISDAFAKIAERKPTHLVLDLRGNRGGNDSFSNPMIAYFADKPFKIASEIGMRTSQITKKFWRNVDIPEVQALKKQIMELEDGARFEPELQETQPRDDALRFEGEVLTLVNRFSLSNAACVASIIQDYGFGTIIGEETSYVPSSCAAMHTFLLPKTRMRVEYAKACGIRPSGSRELRGVIPDAAMRDNFFTDADEMLDAVIDRIKSGN